MIMILGIYPMELKIYVYTKTCVWIFIASLFIIAKTWKQSSCPSTGEGINNLLYSQEMEYYSALKRIAISSHEKTWRKLKCILVSERSLSEKGIYCMIPTTWHSGTGRTKATIKKNQWMLVVRGREGWVSRVWGDETTLCDTLMTNMPLYIYPNP